MKNCEINAPRGFSIVELMVAITLGLLLIAGVLQIFLGNRQAQRMEQSVSRIAESGRIAMDLVSQDLRLAGFYGCAKSIKGEIVNSTLITVAASGARGISPDFSTGAVRGYARPATGSTWSPNTLSADFDATIASRLASARNGSDVLAVYYGQANGAKVQAAVSGASAISVTKTGLCKDSTTDLNNTLVIVGNCKNADLIRVTNTPSCGADPVSIQHALSSTGNSTPNLVGSYEVDTPVYQLAQKIYYVKPSGRTASDGTTIYSLFVDDTYSSQELVEGIEFMHVLYGEHVGSADNIRYVDAGSVTAMENVVSVRIALLAQSFDSVRDTNDTASYTLLDRSIDASTTSIKHSGGRSIRRVYSAAIELRNRMEK